MRVWVIAPDSESLMSRWQRLITAPVDQRQTLFHPTLRGGLPADRHINSVIKEPIPGYPQNLQPIIEEQGACLPPIRYGCRSFDRQWIIPEARVITQPNANLWQGLSKPVQVVLRRALGLANAHRVSLSLSRRWRAVSMD